MKYIPGIVLIMSAVCLNPHPCPTTAFIVGSLFTLIALGKFGD